MEAKNDPMKYGRPKEDWSLYFICIPEMGELIWKERPVSSFGSPHVAGPWNRIFPGKVAGHDNGHGYRTLSIRGIGHRVHRIIWEMVNGPIPDGLMIDHINGDGLDNRISNLRLADHCENQFNKSTGPLNKSGLKGVSMHNDGTYWTAQITARNKKMYLGIFPNKLLAYDAYIQAAIKYHGQHARF